MAIYETKHTFFQDPRPGSINHVSFQDLKPGSIINFQPDGVGYIVRATITNLKYNKENDAMHVNTKKGTIIFKLNGKVFLQI